MKNQTLFFIILISVLIVFLLFFNSLNPKKSSTAKIFGNLHTHTTCSDGSASYEEIIQSALKLNFSFIAITDHAFRNSGPCLNSDNCDYQICEDVFQKCLHETRITCFPGQEVSSNIHLLAIGITSPIDSRLPFKQRVQAIHLQGGLAIASHPYLKGQTYSSDQLLNSNLDAMECTNTPDESQPLPCIFSSDAHRPYSLNFQYMSCQLPIKTISDLHQAIIHHLCQSSRIPYN